MQNSLKYELQNIIRGNEQESQRNTLQTITYYLSRSQSPSSQIENPKQYKVKEIEYLNAFLAQQKLWLPAPDESMYLAEGAE
jgi:hypothetical protein